jgi:hypothetical protein
MKKNLLVLVPVLLLTMAAMAQVEKAEEKEETLKGTHQLLLMVGHSHLRQGIRDNGKAGWKAVPSTGFDYSYWISNHWALGLHNDLIIENFEVEEEGQEVIKRTTPLSSVATAIFKPGKRVGYVAGVGGEFASEGNFLLTRLGIESGWEMKNNWEFSISLLYDIKWNGYDTWVFGFGISKLVRK